jgi:hypothetical protein
MTEILDDWLNGLRLIRTDAIIPSIVFSNTLLTYLFFGPTAVRWMGIRVPLDLHNTLLSIAAQRLNVACCTLKIISKKSHMTFPMDWPSDSSLKIWDRLHHAEPSRYSLMSARAEISCLLMSADLQYTQLRSKHWLIVNNKPAQPFGSQLMKQ